MPSTEERLRAILADLLGVKPDQIKLASRFREDLDVNPLDLVEINLAIVEEFGGNVNDLEAQKFTTVGEAVNYIDTRIKPRLT